MAALLLTSHDGAADGGGGDGYGDSDYDGGGGDSDISFDCPHCITHMSLIV